MNSIGKWYLWLNEPADKRAFWDGNGWSADAKQAKFLESLPSANAEARYAERSGVKGEIVVDRASRNVFA